MQHPRTTFLATSVVALALALPSAALQGIAWQRNLADAERLAAAEGKPLLLCVNMDGEPASERYANSIYEQAGFLEASESFVAVIASPNRHNARDHDERGERLPCPRFGRVTCGEHMSIEPLLYEKYFGGQRYAPRHIGVGTDGRTMFDHFLENDLSAVEASMRRHAHTVEPAAWYPLLRSPEAGDRARVEQLYLNGDEALRRAILHAVTALPSPSPDLLRMGLLDPSAELRRLASQVFARQLTAEHLDLLLDALATGSEIAASDELLARLGKLALGEDRARRAQRLFEGGAARSQLLRLDAWREALASARPLPTPVADEDALIDELTRLDGFSFEILAGERELALARTHLALAQRKLDAGLNPTFFLEDARQAALRAQASGADPTAAAAVLAQVAFWLSDFERATPLVEIALPGRIARAASPETGALLAVLAKLRVMAIYRSEGAREDWPASWLADANAAFELLALHPAGTAAQASEHSQLLSFLGLEAANGKVLRRALAAHPLSAQLHQRYRDHAWVSRGAPGLERAYEDLRGSLDEGVRLWFQGYATLVVAESHVRAEEHTEAMAAYARAIERFEDSAKSSDDYRGSADHYIALALIGRGFEALSEERPAEAASLAADAVVRRPESAAAQDGLGRTGLVLLRRVRTALARGSEDELARLQATIARHAPELWERSSPGLDRSNGPPELR